MSGPQCPHCGQAHPPGTRFCSATGRPLQQPPYPQPPGQQPAYGAPPGYGPPGQAPAGYAPQPQAMLIQPRVAGAGKSPGALLGEAMQLYQKHLAALLLTCAVLMGPVSLLKSGATALI